MPPTDTQLAEAKTVVGWYTLAAAGTGAVPVPAASAAVVAENAAMLSHLSSVLGFTISWATVMESMGMAVTLNMVGKQVFIEGAKLLGWGTGNIWAAIALSGLGATTAGVQTYIVGRLGIEIAKNGGPLTERLASRVIDDAKATYEQFVAEQKANPPKRPPERAENGDVTPPSK